MQAGFAGDDLKVKEEHEGILGSASASIKTPSFERHVKYGFGGSSFLC